MGSWWRHRSHDVEEILRTARPVPRPEFVASLAERVRSVRPPVRHSRLAFAASLTAFVVGSVISFGGLGYAATASYETVKVVKRVVAPSKPRALARTSASDQYRQTSIPEAGGTYPSQGVTGAGAKGAQAVIKKAAKKPAATPTKKPALRHPAAPPVRAAGQLPFTGISLGATLAVSLALVGLGLLLRRRERRSLGS